MIGDVEVRAAGSKGLGVFARRAFARGEFVFRRRHLVVVDEAGIERLSSWPCECGAANCTGTVVGSFFSMAPERQGELLRFAPAFIRREYHRRRANRAWWRTDHGRCLFGREPGTHAL